MLVLNRLLRFKIGPCQASKIQWFGASAMGMLASMQQGLFWFVLFYLLSGFFIFGFIQSTQQYLREISDQEFFQNGRIVLFMSLSASQTLGYFIYYIIADWRDFLFYTISLTTFIFGLLAVLYLRESPYYMITTFQNKTSIYREFKHIAGVNDQTFFVERDFKEVVLKQLFYFLLDLDLDRKQIISWLNEDSENPIPEDLNEDAESAQRIQVIQIQ